MRPDPGLAAGPLGGHRAIALVAGDRVRSSGRPSASIRASTIWSDRSRRGSSTRTRSCRRRWRWSGPCADRPRVGDRAEEPADVIPPLLPLVGQGLDHLGGLRGSLRAEVVDRLVERLAHEGVPDPVDVGAGEPGVVLTGDVRGTERPPLDRVQALGQGRFRLRRGQEEPGGDWHLLRGVVLVGHRVPRAALGHHLEDGQLPRHAPHERLRPGAGEEGRELVELLALPAVGLVVVALGALDLDAEEDPRDLAGQLHGLGLVGQREADRAVLVDPAGGRDHRRGDLVPRPVLLELLGEPVFQDVVPHCWIAWLVAWNRITSRQYRAQLRAYSGLSSRASVSRARLSLDRSLTKKNLLRSRWRAGQVEVNPPDELDVTGQRRRLDLGIDLAQVLLDSWSSSAEVRSAA